MTEIWLGIVLFTGIVLLLVLAILTARSLFVAGGTVEVTINDGKPLTVAVGRKLLDVLGEAEIRLPAACGGSGTCGQCRVRVTNGGGTALPTETGRLTRREIRRGMRLACQVKLRDEMSVEVPEDVFGVKQWACRVRSNTQIASLIKELVLDLPQGELIEFRAGGYIQATCPAYRIKYSEIDIDAAFRDDWDRFDLRRLETGTPSQTTRAYSMANPPEERDAITLNVRAAIPPPDAPDDALPGVVSSYLFSRKPGDEVLISGPYGHFSATNTNAEMVFVGGGVGMAPLRSLILNQLKRCKTERQISFWYGARNRREILYQDEFDQLAETFDNFKWTVALSEPIPDGVWTGQTGFVHDVLANQYLKQHPSPEDCEYYLCGPPMMIRAVRRMLDNLGVDPDAIFFDDFGG